MKSIFEMNKEEVKKEVEKIMDLPVISQKMILHLCNQKKKEREVKHSLEKKVPGSVIKILIDEENAILYSDVSASQEYDARWTYIVDGKGGTEWCLDMEHALLSWMGRKCKGNNSPFATSAYLLLKGVITQDLEREE